MGATNQTPNSAGESVGVNEYQAGCRRNEDISLYPVFAQFWFDGIMETAPNFAKRIRDACGRAIY
jgi:hypothetical protein